MLTMTVHYARRRRRWLWVTLALVLLSFLLGFGLAQAASVRLAWNYTQGASPATGFVLERCEGEGTPCPGVFLPIIRVPIVTQVYEDAGLVAGFVFQWRVLASNDDGVLSAPSNVVAVPIPAPPLRVARRLRARVFPNR